jgi:glycosyltransferase involved in cell wall biosynthesis
MKDTKNIKIAIVHDFIVKMGGAERVLKIISDMYPDSPIYTLLYDEEKMGQYFKGKKIVSSYLRKFPKFFKKRYQWLAPFFLVIPETFDFRSYDLVISSSGAWSKGIITKLDTIHISYVHSPMRFVWDYNEKYLKEKKSTKSGISFGGNSIFTRFFFSYVRIWDRLAADRPDFLVANSNYTKQRIEKYYRREAEVIYPPVSGGQPVKNYSQLDKKLQINNYFLVVSRLSPYKKVDIVVEAFNKLGLPLIIIGEGEQKKYLQKIAKDNIKIIGWKKDSEIWQYYQNARCFIFPAEDDFGISAVEAMSFGLPVVAYKKGGALETIREGITGEFFAFQTAEVLADGVLRFMKNENNYTKDVIKKRAADFSEELFKKSFGDYVDRIMNKQ